MKYQVVNQIPEYVTVGRVYTVLIPKNPKANIWFQGEYGSTFVSARNFKRYLTNKSIKLIKE